MAKDAHQTTWQEDPAEIIVLANRTTHNYMLDLPTGRCRLDAGRRIRTLRSILKLSQVKELVDQGKLEIDG